MSHAYQGVTSRQVYSQERRIDTAEPTPLVIEGANCRSVDFLCSFIATRSPEIHADIATHGAVLFRGFDVRSARDFEKAVLSLSGFEGIDGCLMSERGRDRVEDTRFVLYTNKLYRTGGSLYLGGFHCENFYSPDVPRFIAFYCDRASDLGGETGLVNTAGLYAALPQLLKHQLEAQPFWATAWPVHELAARYGLRTEQVERFCSDFGISVVARRGRKYASLYKPCVIEHPTTRERCLAFNFSMELIRQGFDHTLQKVFTKDYRGKEWWRHRMSWKIPVLGLIDKVDMFLHDPVSVWQALIEKPLGTRVGDLFDATSIERLAHSLRNHFSAFTWRGGDVLIVDNVKMAHCGMPGFGPRVLRALIGNPIRMPYAPGGLGIHIADPNVLPTLAAEIAAYVDSSGRGLPEVIST
jgi:alpha-ketoglutarate-dependent taurine dioxygenase